MRHALPGIVFEPCSLSDDIERGRVADHSVVWSDDEDGQLYWARWNGPLSTLEYPVDHLEGVLIPSDAGTIPLQRSWSVYSLPVMDVGDHDPKVYIKSPMLRMYNANYPNALGDSLRRELLVLEAIKILNCRHIVRYYGAVLHDDERLVKGFALQHCSITLQEVLCPPEINFDPSPWSPAGVMRQVCQAVETLHNCHLVHGDISWVNVMLDNEAQAVVIDFDSAAFLEGMRPSKTTSYRDLPEDDVITTLTDLVCIERLKNRVISKLDLHAEAARHDRMCDMAYPADRFVTPEAAENGQYETAIHRRLERKHCPKFKILVIALDRPKEKVLRRLGNVHDLVSAWMRRTAMGIPRENPDFILDIRTFESLALDCTYPSVEQLEAADLVILVSSDLGKLTSITSNPNLTNWLQILKCTGVRLLGLGSGHVLLASLYDGTLDLSHERLVLERVELQISTSGQAILPTDVTDSAPPPWILEEYCDEHVLLPPDNFIALAHSVDEGPVRVRCMMSPSNASCLQDVKMISLSGHPHHTLSSFIQAQNILSEEDDGRLTKEEADALIASYGDENGRDYLSAEENELSSLEIGKVVLSWMANGFIRPKL